MSAYLLEPYEGSLPLRLGRAGQRLWLRLSGIRTKRGYRSIEVAKEPPRTDKAILAALTSMEGETVDVKELRKGLKGLPPLQLERVLSWGTHLHIREAMEYDPRPIQEMPTDDIERALEWLKEYEPVGKLQRCKGIDYALLLLRSHRPDFHGLPHEQKLAYIERLCTYINEFLEALRKLTAFLEYGDPGRELREATRQTERDVRAAVLKDVDGLTYMKIAEELGEAIPEKYKRKGDHRTVREMVSRGRNVLRRAMGDDGWPAQARMMREEAERWQSLSEEERRVEHVADVCHMTVEEARQFIDLETQDRAEEQAPSEDRKKT